MLSFQRKIAIIIGVVLILFMLFSLSKDLYRSFQMNKQIEAFQEQNEKTHEKIQTLKDQIEYFESENYKDKYAKEILNKLNEGEKVLVIVENDQKENVLIPESELINVSKKEQTCLEAWKEYFFGKEDLDSRIN